MQEALNLEVHPRWREQGFAWGRAIWVECAELVTHCGYKWWQAAPAPERTQVLLELVDIWHFGMSAKLQGAAATDLVASMAAVIDVAAARAPPPRDARSHAVLIEAAETLAAETLAGGDFSLPAFCAALRAADCRFEELFSLYVAKHALNRLRRRRGDADGGYQRVWQGKEDNVHLAEIVETLSADGADGDPEVLGERIYAALEARHERSIPTHP